MIIHELTHLLLSVIAGLAVYLIFRKWQSFLAAILVGVFADIDHLIDFFLYKKSFSINLEEFFSGKYFDYSGKVYLFFHGYEYVVILLILAFLIYLKNKKKLLSAKKVAISILLALSLSLFLHLVYDVFSYKPKWPTYSIIYRVVNNFDHDKFDFRKGE